jgi:pimeloyl-ACP methyl ester carboxylesterase
MVADAVLLLESLGEQGGELPIVIGHSMGAGVAATVLTTRPDLVRAAVLEDPPWFSGSRGDAPDTIQQWAQGFRDHCDEAVVAGRLERPQWPEVEFRPWAVAKTQFDPSLTHREQIARQAPWIEVAAAITRPALVVTGSRDDAVLVSTRSRQRLADLGNRHLEVEVVPGAGHTVRRDHPDAYHQIVDPWMRTQFSSYALPRPVGQSRR